MLAQRFELAAAAFNQALKFDPQNKEIQNALQLSSIFVITLFIVSTYVVLACQKSLAISLNVLGWFSVKYLCSCIFVVFQFSCTVKDSADWLNIQYPQLPYYVGEFSSIYSFFRK